MPSQTRFLIQSNPLLILILTKILDDKSIVNQETETANEIHFTNNKSDDSLQPLSEMDQLMEGFQGTAQKRNTAYHVIHTE